MTASDQKSEPPPKLEVLRRLLMRGFVVVVALALGGYGVLVAVRLITKLY